MKLHFKEQDFQREAAEAVVDCFAGQPRQDTTFTLERTQELLRKTREAALGTAQEGIFENEVLTSVGYRCAPLRIGERHVLENIQSVQRRGNLFESPAVARPQGVHTGYNLTIEMETGTGKTYTYIRTMYELHKAYGWSKFIVIVPSIAIREGVKKSFSMTEEHFLERYGHRITPFIYNSSRPQDIENFAADSRISVMIINTQAFNARSNDARRIYQELDQFGTRKPIEIIAQTNPIVIIDEPQSVDGTATLTAMQDFKPLFTLRYSATHREEYNKIFRLDALDAYNGRLVKKIQVKGIARKGTAGTSGYLYLERIQLAAHKAPTAMLEFEKRFASGIKRVRKSVEQGANLYDLSGGMEAYRGQLVTEIDGARNIVVIGGEELTPGDILNDTDELTFRRIQIRETIQSHLEKEKELFAQGVKVLSLFFIDAVDKYRSYNADGKQEQGDYARIFEEEYRRASRRTLELFHQDYDDYLDETDPTKVHKGYMPTDEANPEANAKAQDLPAGYAEYLQRDEAKRVHEGYFSIDKKGKSVDPSVKRGSDISDDPTAYELIMRDKERLLSLEEPVRFIFSHSALKEGWDNPNVFQICALKNVEASSEIRRRQEVGRGMRLCVNKEGNRLDADTVGADSVHRINRLTVIASETYEAFARGLQAEIAASLTARPQKADDQYFVGKLIRNEQGEERRLSEDDAKKINKLLFKQDIIDDNDKLTDEGRTRIEQNDIPLPEHLKTFSKEIGNLLKTIVTGEIPKPENDRDTVKAAPNRNFAKAEFQALWNIISEKTVYQVKFDTQILIKDSAKNITENLVLTKHRYEVSTGELQTGGTEEQLRQGEMMSAPKRRWETVEADSSTSSVRYDIVGEIEVQTGLKRTTIVAILKLISPTTFALVRQNPEEFIAGCSKYINEAKANLIVNHISYHKRNEQYDAATVFTNIPNVPQNTTLYHKHIYDYLATDSGIEKKFAAELEQQEDVVVYAKLPKNFVVPTPIANYTPDWAIVFDKDKVRHIYFVAETKGSTEEQDLRGIELAKIECARKHFSEIGGDEVRFGVVKDYDGLLNIVAGKE
jgi:type III restriction enzyme